MVYQRLAEILHKMFVINANAIAIQMPDGKYVTKYLPVSPFVIEAMLRQRGSLGCYQQGYFTNCIKWICFDFDCPKDVPDVERLYREVIRPFRKILDEAEITYLTEFSGRRGIHVWFVFESIFAKGEGYQIVQELWCRFEQLAIEGQGIWWNIDFFPKTDGSRLTELGLQVKCPLSTHKKGERSYFFEGEFSLLVDVTSEQFMERQYDILQHYKRNDPDLVLEKLEIQNEAGAHRGKLYQKCEVVGGVCLTPAEAVEILSETLVFSNIFDRMRNGVAQKDDWLVLLGTLGHCDDDGYLVKMLFSSFPNYDMEKTLSNIAKLREYYYPPLFRYLYQKYDIEMEEWVKPDETGLQFLFRRMNLSEAKIREIEVYSSEKYLDIQSTVEKERHYFFDNDEVPYIRILNDLERCNAYDFKNLQSIAEEIIRNKRDYGLKDLDFEVYERVENDDRIRKMVSLGARERVLTTYLTLCLCDGIKTNFHSDSYNISYGCRDEIFYGWYSSWNNYIGRVKTFLQVPFLSDYSVAVIDLKRFYDNIDFVSVYQAMEAGLDDEKRNILGFLLQFNEALMLRVSGNRKGVPQGPAYARVISEFFLDEILTSVYEKYKACDGQFTPYRYVDDIVIFSTPDFDLERLYDELRCVLLEHGLPVNAEKSKFFGKIADIDMRGRRMILHSDKMNYDLKEQDFNHFRSREEVRAGVDNYLHKQSFSADLLSRVFGRSTVPEASEQFYRRHAREIFGETKGRGSGYIRFYRYFFSTENFIWEALDKGWINRIQVTSINFEVFINEYYLHLKEKRIDPLIAYELYVRYIKSLEMENMCERSRIVIQAIDNAYSEE